MQSGSVGRAPAILFSLVQKVGKENQVYTGLNRMLGPPSGGDL